MHHPSPAVKGQLHEEEDGEYGYLIGEVTLDPSEVALCKKLLQLEREVRLAVNRLRAKAWPCTSPLEVTSERPFQLLSLSFYFVLFHYFAVTFAFMVCHAYNVCCEDVA